MILECNENCISCENEADRCTSCRIGDFLENN